MLSPSKLPASVVLSLLPFLPSLTAQTPADNSSSNTLLQDLATCLNYSGYTSLSTALSEANQSDWISGLSQGNWTLFAPTNQAFTQAPQSVASNATLLAEYLSYHFVFGNQRNATSGGGSQGGGGGAGGGGGGGGGSSSTTCAPSSETSSATSTGSQGGQVTTQGTNVRFWKRSDFWNPFSHHLQSEGSGGAQLASGVYPNVTLGRTLLNSSDLVQLEGGKNQVLAWTRSGADGNVTILNQAPNVTVNNATQWRNFFIAEVNGVILPPGNLTTALQATNETLLYRFASQIQTPAVNGTNVSVVELIQEQARGFTFFAPTDQAFTSGAVAESMQGNQTAMTDAIFNHYVNGSTLYSPTLKEIAANASSGSAQQTVTSAGGQPFTFTQNQTGLFVSNGNGTQAQVVRPDVLVENGVVHIIDHVLFNSGSDSSAASSAFSSASAAATESSTDTQVIGGFPVPTGSQTQSGGGGGGSASMTSSAQGGGQSSQPTETQSSQSSSSTQSGSQTSSGTSGGGGGGGGQSTSSAPPGSTPSGFRFRRA